MRASCRRRRRLRSERDMYLTVEMWGCANRRDPCDSVANAWTGYGITLWHHCWCPLRHLAVCGTCILL